MKNEKEQTTTMHKFATACINMGAVRKKRRHSYWKNVALKLAKKLQPTEEYTLGSISNMPLVA